MDGGITGLTADLRGLRITGVSVSGGAGRIDLRLPRPSGAVPIHMDGGAASVSITRPEDVAVRATMPEGAAEIQFDERSIGPILDQTPLESPDYDGATNRYDIELMGGVAQLTIAKG